MRRRETYMSLFCIFSILLLPLTVLSFFSVGQIIQFRELIDSSDNLSCHIFKDDIEVIKSWHFYVTQNPTSHPHRATYAEVNEYKKVVRLHIYHQTSIPLTLFCLRQLDHLRIIRSTFEGDNDQFPYQIYKLASTLKSLIIESMTFKELPDEINYLKNLNSLVIHDTPLNKLPDDISGLSSLESCQISQTNITDLPKSIVTLNRLLWLNLFKNKNLRSIQAISGHPNLASLKVKDCPIEKFPKNLPNITQLVLVKTFIESLEGIETVGNGSEQRKEFSFENNQIKFVDNAIGSVKNLILLNLAQNPLTDLPREIYKLVYLEFLNLGQTCIDRTNFNTIQQRFKSQSKIIRISSYQKAKC